MPSNLHTQCYQQLANLLAQLKAALSEDRTTEFAPLLQEYAKVMAVLPQAIDKDVGPGLAFLTSLHQEVTDLLAAAEQQRDVLRPQLVQMEKRKQQIVAYTKAQMLS